MTKSEALRVKEYFQKIADVNRIARPDLQSEWEACYQIIYCELNGKESTEKAFGRSSFKPFKPVA